jgi:signal transduction histidine kinase
MLLVAILALLLPVSWVGGWLRWAVMATAMTHVGLLILVVAAWRAGVWQARFFALSFGCLFAGSLPMIGVWFFETNFRDAAMRGLMIGSVLEMLLLSLAVADRFARTQKLLVEETEQRRMIESAYSDELEDEVRERTRELEEANGEKDRILAVIGHDLRGPLTGLMRAADEERSGFSKDVARTGRALLLMIEDLVLWTRLRAGRKTTSAHRATSLIMPAVALHHSLAEHDGVELILEVADDLLIETDLVLAQTLVRNLLANALKFARTQVVIRASEEGNEVRFVVGNDGPALSPEVAQRLAARVDEPMTATSGMGLKLCREICEALEIPLEAHTPKSGGTEFGFTLKRVESGKETHV